LVYLFTELTLYILVDRKQFTLDTFFPANLLATTAELTTCYFCMYTADCLAVCTHMKWWYNHATI